MPHDAPPVALLNCALFCLASSAMLYSSLLAPFLLLSASVLGSPVSLERRNNTSSLDVPPPPELKWLYTLYATVPEDLMNNKLTPAGIRRALPITGGNFTGPGLEGKLLDLGADWGTVSHFSPERSSRISTQGAGPRSTGTEASAAWQVDPRTGIFTADTRYNGRTKEGEDLYFRTTGPVTPDGSLHLYINIETGSERLYWLNNVLGKRPVDTLSSKTPRSHTDWRSSLYFGWAIAVGVLHNLGKNEDGVMLLRIDAYNVSAGPLSATGQ